MKKLVCALLSVLLLAAPMAQLAPLAYAEEPGAAVTEPQPAEEPGTDPETKPDGDQAAVGEAAPAEAEEEDVTTPADADEADSNDPADADTPDPGTLPEEPAGETPEEPAGETPEEPQVSDTPEDPAAPAEPAEPTPAPQTPEAAAPETSAEPEQEEYEVSTMEIGKPVKLMSLADTPAPIDLELPLKNAGFVSRLADGVGYSYQGHKNSMYVTVAPDDPTVKVWPNPNGVEQTPNYQFTLEGPGIDGKKDVVLIPSVTVGDGEPIMQKVARWVVDIPTEGQEGQYTIKAYAASDSGHSNVLGETTLDVYKVVFKDSEAEARFDEKVDYGVSGEFVQFLYNRPLTYENSEGKTITGWTTVPDGKTAIQTIDKSYVKEGADHIIELYPIIGENKIYKATAYLNKADAEAGKGATFVSNGTLTLESAEYGYDPQNCYKQLFIRNEGNQPLKIWGDGFELQLGDTTEDGKLPAGAIATLTFRAKGGLGVGEHNWSMWCYSDEIRPFLFVNVAFEVTKKKAHVKFETRDKDYGEIWSQSNVGFTINDKDPAGVTLAELGFKVESDGFTNLAAAREAVYPYIVTHNNLNTSPNYQITYEDPAGAVGVKVNKAKLAITAKSASSIKKGQSLENSVITATATNTKTGGQVPGTFEWVDKKQTFNETGKQTAQFRFIPDPSVAANYEDLEEQDLEVEVSERNPSVVRPRSNDLTVTYDGKSHGIEFTATAQDNNGQPQPRTDITVQYSEQGKGDWKTGSNDYPVDAGTYDVLASVPEDIENGYAAASAQATLVILPKPVRLEIVGTGTGSTSGKAKTKEYDGTVAATLVAESIISKDFVSGDKVSVNCEASAIKAEFDTANARNGIHVKVTIPDGADILEGEDKGNYRVSFSEMHTSGNIEPKSITVALRDPQTRQKDYGQELTLTADDFICVPDDALVEGDSMSDLHLQIQCDGAAREATPGSYTIDAVSGGAGGNYTVALQKDDVNKTPAIQVNTVKPVPVEDVSAPLSGFIGTAVDDLHLSGTFRNPYVVDWTVDGDLVWDVAPETPLNKGPNVLHWKFIPTAPPSCYEEVDGYLTVTGTEKPVPDITLTSKVMDPPVGNDFKTTYNGEPKTVTATASYTDTRTDAVDKETHEVPESDIVVTYHYIEALPPEDAPVPVTIARSAGLALLRTRAAASADPDEWTTDPPVNAGIYEVRAVVAETDAYAANSATAGIIIERATPAVSDVSAGSVPFGSKLDQSQLTGNVTGVDSQLLPGTWSWQNVDGETASNVYAERGKPFNWRFQPDDADNYRSVTGICSVPVEDDTRVVSAAVAYNLPDGYADADYATVVLQLGADQYYPDDFVCFYSDPDCKVPISEEIPITKDETYDISFSSPLAKEGGTVYVRISNSVNAIPVVYGPPMGFTLPQLLVHVPVGAEVTLPVELDNDHYTVQSATWNPGSGDFLSLREGTGSYGRFLAVNAGTATVTAKLDFQHPDPRRSETIPLTQTAQVEVVDDVGTLTITQSVTGSGAEAGHEFHFTVTLKKADGTEATDVNGIYGDLMFVNGVAQFPLRAGQSVTAWALPEGYSYTVVEDNANTDGYSTGASNAQGTIVKNEVAGVAFVNRRDAPPAPQGGSGSGGSSSDTAPASDEYIVCEACGHHFWEPYLDGWRCTTCGHLRGTTGVPADAAAKAAQAAQTAQRGRVPQTADESHPALWVLLFLASAAGLGLTLRARKKRQ